jgi:hypothetical protein
LECHISIIHIFEPLTKGVKTLTNTEPTVVSWQWNVPPYLIPPRLQYSVIGLLVVIESVEDHVPQENKIFNVKQLVLKEKHVGLRSIYVVRPE